MTNRSIMDLHYLICSPRNPVDKSVVTQQRGDERFRDRIRVNIRDGYGNRPHTESDLVIRDLGYHTPAIMAHFENTPQFS